MIVHRFFALAALLGFVLGVSACGMSPAHTVGPPPVPAKPSGKIPTAALMPWYTKDLVEGDHAYKYLTACLKDRYVFDFVGQAEAARAVEQAGVDVEQVFGPSDEEYAEVARILGVDYVMWGAVSILKNLTFAGWRKDITSMVYLHAADGSGVDTWRSNTAMTFTDTETALDSTKMIDSTMNNLCARIMDSMSKRAEP